MNGLVRIVLIISYFIFLCVLFLFVFLYLVVCIFSNSFLYVLNLAPYGMLSKSLAALPLKVWVMH